MSRGVQYIIWEGDERIERMLNRSIVSLKAVHPDLPYNVVRLPEGASLLEKAQMYDLSPYDETLYLDADTVVLGNLDFGFEKAKKHGMAICLCECPWARRFTGLSEMGDVQEWNTGVMFFTRGASGFFKEWKSQIHVDSSLLYMSADGVKRMTVNDQASFAMAIERSGFNPFVLSLNWNFRPLWQKTFFGPVKVWHDYSEPPASLIAWSKQQAEPGAVLQCVKTE